MSSEQKTNITNNGVTFLAMLTIVFMVLKLCGAIGWSWWWVLSPLWIFAGLVFVISTIYLFVGSLIVLIKKK